jgi:ferredoxin-thioredoxin reductase catalytic chain
MNKEEFYRVCEVLAQKNDFMLNPDKEHLDLVIDGVMENEKLHGLKLCPCRLRDGTREQDLKLLCPCNFKAQEIWQSDGRCWCGLFVRRS